MTLPCRISITLLILIIVGCSGGGGGISLVVGDLSGPAEIPEGTTVEFGIEASGDTEITFIWAVEPAGFGDFNGPDNPTVLYSAPEVHADTEITISVLVNSSKGSPVIRSISSIIINTDGSTGPDDDPPPVNHSPTAGVYVSTVEVEPGVEIQFFDDSTDPDGNDDIIQWEWDFSYNPNDGFQFEDGAEDPVRVYEAAGNFLVQLRVIDSGGLSDMLDDPIEISVVSIPHPPEAVAFIDADVISFGNYVKFHNISSDPDGPGDLVKWEWDFSFNSDDGFIVENFEKEPYIEFVKPGVFDIQLRVTDSTGLNDMLDEPLQITVIQDHPAAAYGGTYGGSEDDTALGIELDPDGNLHSAGTFEGEVDFDSGWLEYFLTADNKSTYLCKFKPAGFAVIAATYWDSNDFRSLTSDGDGSLYITGRYYYSGPANYKGPYIRCFDTVDLSYWENYKENASGGSGGAFPWWGWKYSYAYYPVACGYNGEIYYIQYTGYVEYYDDWWWDSELQWWTSYRTYVEDWEKMSLIHSMNNSQIWNIQLAYVSWISNSSPGISSMVVGVNKNGIVLALNEGGGIPSNVIRHIDWDGAPIWEIPYPPGSYRFNMIKSDADGNIYLIVSYNNGVSKISPDGEILWSIWSGADINDFHLYEDGSFITTGTFTGSVDFDPGPDSTFKTSKGIESGYVSAFGPDGNFLWVETWGGSELDSITSNSVCADDSGTIYVCGSFSGSIDLGPPWESDMHNSNGGTDAYVLKLSQ